MVYLRESVEGKRRLIKTPVDVSRPSDFNTKTKRQKWVRGNSDEANRKNKLLLAILENAQAQYLIRENQAQSKCREYSIYMNLAIAAESEGPYEYGRPSKLNAEEQSVLEKLKSMDRERVKEILKIYTKSL